MDISLYYQEKGNKEPLILLHGNGEDGSYFKNQIDYFCGRYRVIAVDTRGHGKSPRGTKPFTIEQFSCDLYDFMMDLKISNAVILGFSDGANIAMEFAMKYPNKVKALILNGGNLNPRGIKRTTQIPIEIGYKIARQFASKSPNAKKNAEMLGLMVHEPNIEPDELTKITAPTPHSIKRSNIFYRKFRNFRQNPLLILIDGKTRFLPLLRLPQSFRPPEKY